MNSQEKKSDISKVVSDYLCLSCGACSAICKKGAINYFETVGGYLFPKIDSELCNNCGLCYEVCPGLSFGGTLSALLPVDPFVGTILSCQVGRATCDGIFNNSQSGGVATALLAYLIETQQIKGAVVAIMRSATPPRGDVLLATSVNELMTAQKSKYTPIPLLSALSQIRKLDGLFAFVGLPCHIHGLYNLFDLCPDLKDKILVKIGLICDRIMTCSAVDFLGLQAGEIPIRNLVFRDKQRPSYPGNPLVETESGKQITLTSSLRIAIKDFFTPARCRLCFDKLNVYSDIVLGDPHGISNVDRTYGETLVITRTEQGQSLITKATNADYMKLRQVNCLESINGQLISKKRIEWTQYVKTWVALGKPAPNYGFSPDSICIDSKFRKKLLHSLNLNSFISRKELFRKTNRWLLQNKTQRAFFYPAKRLRKTLITIRKRFNFFDWIKFVS
jgi:coenzyme F420 hydrogenase subunit beta